MSQNPAAHFGTRPKFCSICSAQATTRCAQCGRLFCTEHASYCQHASKTQDARKARQAIFNATCGICGRIVTDPTNGRLVPLAACHRCNVLVCDLCVGNVNVQPGPHGFSVEQWCEVCSAAGEGHAVTSSQSGHRAS